MGCPYKILSKFFKVPCLSRFHVGVTCFACIQKLRLPPNLWLLAYLLFSIVSPWATFGYLLSYGRCSPKVAQLLATFCSSLGYLLFGGQRSSLIGCPYKKLSKFFKVPCLSRFHVGVTCFACIQKLRLPPNLWLLAYLLFSIVSPWATFGYLLSYGRFSPKAAQPLPAFCSSLDYLLFGSQRSSLMGCPYKKLSKFFKLSCLPRFHLDLTCLVCIQKLFLPPNLWLLGYLLFPIVAPWATFGYLLSYAICSPRVAQGHLLWAFQIKICQNFSKSDVCLVSM